MKVHVPAENTKNAPYPIGALGSFLGKENTEKVMKKRSRLGLIWDVGGKCRRKKKKRIFMLVCTTRSVSKRRRFYRSASQRRGEQHWPGLKQIQNIGTTSERKRPTLTNKEKLVRRYVLTQRSGSPTHTHTHVQSASIFSLLLFLLASAPIR